MKQATAFLFFASATVVLSQDIPGHQPESIPLTVAPGVPLHLYLTKHVSKRVDAPVEAKLAGSVYAFDREVIPAGTRVIGHISRLESVSKWERMRAILGGDFTPLHVAQIEFTSLVLPDGRQIQLHTDSSPGLNSLFPLRPPRPRSPNAQSAGASGGMKQTIKDQANNQMDRIRSIPELVRGPNKKEWVSDYLMSRLPYHPQYVRSRTRFDAELTAPLNFGSEPVTPDSVALLGTQPDAGSIVHARLVTPLDSRSSTQGQKVEAVLEQPLFSADHKLVLPEGTQVDGSVVLAKRAGWFHHVGRLRFNFQNLELPLEARLLTEHHSSAPSQPPPALQEKGLQTRMQGTLAAAEGDKAPLKVDTEGGVQAADSKTRFIGTALAALISRAAADNDPLRAPSSGGTRGAIIGRSQNVGGRTLGGGLGFGLFGTIAAQSSRNVGAALGYYGLAWSVFSTVIAHGPEVQFDKDAVVDIKFNTRTSKPESKGAVSEA